MNLWNCSKLCSETTEACQWFHFPFEHFDVICMVYKSLDNEKLSSVYHCTSLILQHSPLWLYSRQFSRNSHELDVERVVYFMKSSINNQIFEVRAACWVFYFSFSIKWTFKPPQCCSERVVVGGGEAGGGCRVWTVHGLLGNEGCHRVDQT